MQTEKNYQISYHYEYIHCSHEKCPKCSTGKSHGPYWFASIQDDKYNIKRVYIGREFRNVQLKEFSYQDFFSMKSTQTEKKNHCSKNPPSQSDFNTDISAFRKEYIKEELKKRYKKLIKKYHPDQFPYQQECNQWMAEINVQYEYLLKKAV